MNKQELRKIYQSKREKLSQEEIESFSLDIANKALELPIWDKTNFHLFLTIEDKKEVNTQYLLHILQGRDKTVIVPKANFETADMIHFLLQENTTLRVSKYGIPEPTNGIEISPESIEVVFVPLLAFDKKGNRIGYGKGFYDRFLEKCKNTLFVGLSFFEPEDTLKADIQDIPLHYCVTPKKLHIF